MAISGERIGFLGLGIMGSRMAANVRRAGFDLTVWTHTSGKAAAWAAEHGATAVATPAEVAAASDIVISIVVDGAQVESVLLGEGGVVAAARPGLLCIDMSTILPADTRRIGEALASHAVAMLDAPVTGSSPRAEAGTLTIMVGGETAEVQRARPVLEAMGELIVHVGPLGHGATLKVINQALAAANITAVAEALVLAQATELDLDALVNVISNGSGGSAMLELKSAAMRAHDYTTMFKTEHLLKDVGLSLATAAAAGVPFPSAAHAGDLLESTVADGHASDDFSAVIEAVEKRAGVRLGDS